VVSPSPSDSFLSNKTFDWKLPASPAQRSGDSTTICHGKQQSTYNRLRKHLHHNRMIDGDDRTSTGDAENLQLGQFAQSPLLSSSAANLLLLHAYFSIVTCCCGTTAGTATTFAAPLRCCTSHLFEFRTKKIVLKQVS
jgi:hypothetical protein